MVSGSDKHIGSPAVGTMTNQAEAPISLPKTEAIFFKKKVYRGTFLVISILNRDKQIGINFEKSGIFGYFGLCDWDPLGVPPCNEKKFFLQKCLNFDLLWRC